MMKEDTGWKEKKMLLWGMLNDILKRKGIEKSQYVQVGEIQFHIVEKSSVKLQHEDVQIGVKKGANKMQDK